MKTRFNALETANQRRHAFGRIHWNAQWQASGAYAANLLGIPEQVPTRIVILTDGISRHVRLDALMVSFRRALHPAICWEREIGWNRDSDFATSSKRRCNPEADLSLQ